MAPRSLSACLPVCLAVSGPVSWSVKMKFLVKESVTPRIIFYGHKNQNEKFFLRVLFIYQSLLPFP